ncbi:hypothetical protein D3C87_680530 [compost metagenome]
MPPETMTAFPPLGASYLWQPQLVAAKAVANSIIALTYFTLPVMLLVFTWKRPDIPNPLVFWLFATSITLSGVGHVFGVITIWRPLYWPSAFVDATTAMVSLATAFVVLPLLPRLLRSASVTHYLEQNSKAALEEKNQALEVANQRLRDLNQDMQAQMRLLAQAVHMSAAREERIKELRDENERLKRTDAPAQP